MSAVPGGGQVGQGSGEEVGPPQGMMVEGEGEGEFSGFKLPYQVATIVDLEQRAYLNEKAGNSAEWIYQRVHQYCGMAKDPTRLLRQNKDSLKASFEALQVPMKSELHFRGKDASDAAEHEAPWADHTFGSAGLLVFLLWIMKNKGTKGHSKVHALNLMLSLAQKAWTMLLWLPMLKWFAWPC